MNKLLNKHMKILGKRYDGMMSRCYRESDASYNHYGKKGIRVCSEWIKNPDSFKEWCVKELYLKGYSIEFFIKNSRKIQLDRKNGNLHYSPDNCTFVSAVENQRNKLNRTRKIITSAEGEDILV